MQVKPVCAFRFKDPNNPQISEIEVDEFPRQRGVWNKNVVTWWIIGEVDAVFEDRVNFLTRCINIAWTEWDIEIPIQFVKAASEEEADVIIEFGGRANDPYYADNNAVLAYAGFPDGALKGYVKVFTDLDWNAHGQTGFNIIIVLTHEFGHTIGLSHSERQAIQDLMGPYYNKHIIEASDYDIARAVAGYGAREYANQDQHDRLEFAHANSKQRIKSQEILASVN